ncbi:hypothetical protein [Duganella qianjiadongensis]|uniref:Porin n=1 Tax=Duganella qianjiadongensis TaxID=2692176 RepID=A0ABW9VR30_9BURK|nr:hypothetical protein [Duganella qianjiadongensis]MYM42013.1 hypothetical protein [Duganella qianjiadongensis]
MANPTPRKIACWSTLALLLGAISPFSGAQEYPSKTADEHAFTVRGFGTLGLTRTDTDAARYRANWQNSGGADKKWDPSVDSKLGVQADWSISDSIAFTAQSTASKGASGSYAPKIEWAYASYWIGSDLAVRIGRTRLPTFSASDYYNIGNAYLWVRPPADVYNQLSFFSVDGVDLVYEYHTDQYSLLLQPVAGKSKFDLYFPVAGGRLKGNVANIRGINTSVQAGEISLRLGWMRGQLDLTNQPEALASIVAGLEQASMFFPAASGLVQRFGLHQRDAKFVSLGATYDGEHLMVLSEFTKRRTSSIMPDSTGWYITAGLKQGRWTPYITFSEQRINSQRYDNSIPAAGQFLPLSQAVNGVLGYPTDDKAIALGVRYEFTPKMMLKAEIQNINGGLPPLQGRTQPGTVKVLSTVVDFIF